MSEDSRAGPVLSRAEVESVECLTGQTFTLAACGLADMRDLRTGQVVAPRTALMCAQSLAGQHVMMQPPVRTVGQFLTQYLTLKQASPHSVSACIVVPAWYSQKWRGQLKGMQLLKQYPKGSKFFETAEGSTGLPYDTEVWWDPVQPKAQLAAMGRTAVAMQFSGTVRGAPTRVLLDTGASDVIMTRALAQRAGLQVRADTHWKVKLGDGKAELACEGSCTVPLRLQGYRGTVRAAVVSTLLDGFDLILGESWLNQVGACLDYGRRQCFVRSRRKMVTITPREAACAGALAPHRPGGQGQKPPPRPLSAMRVTRLEQKGQLECWWLATINKAEDGGPGPLLPLTRGQTVATQRRKAQGATRTWCLKRRLMTSHANSATCSGRPHQACPARGPTSAE